MEIADRLPLKERAQDQSPRFLLFFMSYFQRAGGRRRQSPPSDRTPLARRERARPMRIRVCVPPSQAEACIRQHVPKGPEERRVSLGSSIAR